MTFPFAAGQFGTRGKALTLPMNLTTERQLRRFSGAVFEIYRRASVESLSQDFVAALAAVIPADRYSVNWLASRRTRTLSMRMGNQSGEGRSKVLQVRNWFRYPEYPAEADINVFNRFMGQHPLFSHWEKHGASSVRWSDVTTFRVFREKALYREYFRHVEVRHQLGAASLRRKDGDLAIACNRRSRDFTVGEKRVLGMMMPHFEHAMALACGRAALNQVLVLEGAASSVGAVMIVTDAGVMLLCNAKAKGLCEKFFGRSDGAPEPIINWLARESHRALKVSKGGETLIVERDVAQPAEYGLAELAGDDLGRTVYLLRLAERSTAPVHTALRSLGLTPKEAEVLAWMAQGKRNAEIAIILGTRPKTIDKHVEHIFKKLGVENRTSAIAMAWETVGS